MTKQYGNKVGNPSSPTEATAPGIWALGTELNRQRGLGAWPVSPQFLKLSASTGDYVYVASSGASDPLVQADTFLIPSGQSVSTTTYETLFNSIGYNYGGTGGSFTLPNLLDTGYLKGSNSASLSAPSVYGSGFMPNHTHTVTVFSPSTGSWTNPGSNNGAGYGGPGPNTITSYEGSNEGNQGKRIYMIPLISLQDQQLPIGAVAPLFCSEDDISSVLTSQCLVASGQEVSRTTYSDLFNRIGTIYGQGDGSTTFNVPDLRGLFVTAPSSTVGLVNVSGTATTTSGFIPDDYSRHRHQAVSYSAGSCGPSPSDGGSIGNGGVTTPASGPSTLSAADENRPKNISLIYTLVATT